MLTFHYLSRLTNWHFYHPEKSQYDQQNKFKLSHQRLWHWAKLGLQNATNQHDKALFLGALIHLTEDLTVPAHVVPVYHGPVAIKLLDNFEHLTQRQDQANNLSIIDIIKDDIDTIVVNPTTVEKYIDKNANLCNILQHQSAPDQIRNKTAIGSVKAINSPIHDCNSITWQEFWPPFAVQIQQTLPISAKYFHQYKYRFMQQTTLTSGKYSCHLNKNDQRYIDFLQQQYQSAIQANIALLHWFMEF